MQSWICLFQDAKMLEDETIKSYFARISKIVIGIRSCGGSKKEDEVVWQILKTLTPTYKQIAQMIEQVIPFTTNFIRETPPCKITNI